jgi:hypothetical protein
VKVESANSIWGVPLLRPATRPAAVNHPAGGNFSGIERQLHTFLTELIEKWRPELILVIERKGTAILRALKESEECRLDWPWEKILSSESLDQVSSDFLRSKRILIFDDMMKTAEHMREVLSKLEERGILQGDGENVRVAAFAVHEDCPAELKLSKTSVNYAWFYRYLTSTSYQSIQIQIVGMLQRAGSLMLDTEHVEVRLRLRSNFNRLVQALRRRAQAYVFHSSDQRMNITVFYEDDQSHVLPADLFPAGTDFSNIVKKCRFVDRGGDEYAIIPICFPSILSASGDWPVNKSEVELLGPSVCKSTRARFNGVGLIAALEVLRWALKDLAVLGSSDYALSLPRSRTDKQTKGGYTLEHLKVVFPTINLDELTERIAQIDKEATSEGVRLRGVRFDPTSAPEVTDDELHRDAMQLLQVIRYQLDQRILEEDLLAVDRCDSGQSCYLPGLRLGEIFRIGERMNWDKARVSTLCDILIDQAALSTDVALLTDENGAERTVRIFAPAGEVVSEMVRRYTTQWGLPNGF